MNSIGKLSFLFCSRQTRIAECEKYGGMSYKCALQTLLLDLLQFLFDSSHQRPTLHDRYNLQLTLSILQCKNGHPLCSACKSKVGSRCPTCRQELGDIRCLVLEKVAEKFKHSCKYQPSGCPQLLPYSIKSKHEEQCSFRPFNCPYPRCSVVGDISFLVSHLKDSHNGRTSNGCSYNERYIITYETGFQDRTWKPVVSFLLLN